MERIKKGEVVLEDSPPANDFASMIHEGVEVVDVKAIPKEGDSGIPDIEERKTWDKV